MLQNGVIPIKNKEAMTVAVELWEGWICTFGRPQSFISDNGGEFTADEMAKALMEVSEIRQQCTTPYNPRANGQVERFNKVLANRLAKYTDKYQNTWDDYVSTVCMDYNMSKHSATGETPYFLVFGQEPRKGIDVLADIQNKLTFDVERWRKEGIPSMLERLKVAQECRKKKQIQNMKKKNKDKVNPVFRVQEKVWVRLEPRTDTEKEEHKKLKLPWHGPFEISKADPKKYGNTYRVKGIFEGAECERTINVKNLKRYVERPDWLKLEDDWVDKRDELNVEGEMEVDQDKSGDYIPEPEPQRPIENPQAGEGEKVPEKVQEAEPGQGRKRSRPRGWQKKVGDLVDVKFDKKVGSNWRRFWACGTIKEVDPNEKDRVYCTFEDGKNEDWYSKKDDSDMLEIRRCENKNGHQRSKELSVTVVNERKKKRQRVTSVQNMSLPTGAGKKNDGIPVEGMSEKEQLGGPTGYPESGIANSWPDCQQVSKEGNPVEGPMKLKMHIKGVPVEMEGSAKQIMEVIKRL